MTQIYENYTPADFEVWSLLYKRQEEVLKERASKEYLSALKSIEFSEKSIPRFTDTNKILDKATGWGIHVVPGLIPPGDFFELLAQKKFCSSTWLRKPEQLDYLEEPDMFHDTFGHVPLLVNPFYASFMKAIGEVGIKYTDNHDALTMLQRLYWFTIEFGLIREEGELRIYGAGILSSPQESVYSLSDKPEHREFDIEPVFDTPFYKDRLQTCYYIIDSYEQLYNSVGQIDKILEERVRNGVRLKNPV
ncbi:hypothetical protein FUAX_23850 [Fulvitalea axinellae]|uniref:phenylalanine 4-monooxygenase n=1 Tax=Fulvitalea axinellae TaxID=1182444 RepID=A0AAU9D1Z0_9BACT|nr:hypothetical protein FUAX_23850 [Fulvitalea axinellae]